METPSFPEPPGPPLAPAPSSAPAEASPRRRGTRSRRPGDPPAAALHAVQGKARSSQAIAWLLDECLRVPGTRIRFGLDPILGLVPGGGETVASVIGLYLLADASRRGIPFRTLFKMGGNVLVNAAVGAIPGFGDLFSVWFKSNSRNLALMRHFLDSADGSQARGGWGGLAFIGLVLAAVVAANILIWLAAWQLLRLLLGL